MPRQDLRRTQGEAGIQRSPGIVEDLVEHVPQRQHGWAGIDPYRLAAELAHLAAHRRRGLEQGDREAGPQEIQRCDQPADPRSDDYGVSRPHCPTLKNAPVPQEHD